MWCERRNFKYFWTCSFFCLIGWLVVVDLLVVVYRTLSILLAYMLEHENISSACNFSSFLLTFIFLTSCPASVSLFAVVERPIMRFGVVMCRWINYDLKCWSFTVRINFMNIPASSCLLHPQLVLITNSIFMQMPPGRGVPPEWRTCSWFNAKWIFYL